MSLPLALVFAAGGLGLLAGGGEVLLRGAISVSKRLHITPAVVGLTVVAFATSLPELAVSLLAALRGEPDVATANVVGSNIFNLGAIFGVSALLFGTVAFKSETLRGDFLMMLLTAGASFLVCRNLYADRIEGVVLLTALILFLWYRVRHVHATRAERMRAMDDAERTAIAAERPVWLSGLLILAGVALLTAGAEALVRGAIALARIAGVSERVIGLTLVSAGTGMPELATAVIAAVRKHAGVAVGNIIGSNIFNVCAILGTVAVVKPLTVAPEIFARDLWWMLGFSAFIILPVARGRMTRVDGGLIFAAYVAYVWLLI